MGHFASPEDLLHPKTTGSSLCHLGCGYAGKIMCGIAGFVLRDGNADSRVIQAMCAEIRHRGPDDGGFRVDGPCAIGMRRLSIIDLSTGHQPIGNEDGSVWVVFNGEIYNYQDLRQDLISRGHRFQTNSDTETLVHLYEQDGVDGLTRLRGMFAYAIWDANRRALLLARDRFGKKPLYYALLPQGLFFASELECLRVAGVPQDLDEEGLRLYFQFLHVPDPFTAFRSVRKLPSGSWLLYHADGSARQGRYWRLPPPAEKPQAGQSEAEAAVKLREKFDEAVRIRMMADVPLGAFLSGGIDSSLVVASMALQSSEPIRTFSIGFEESAFNELEYAAMVARKYRTDHHQLIVRPDSIALTEKIVRHFGEPFADSSAIPTYMVSEFAAQHVKVALTGDGGDELFGGYDHFWQLERLGFLDWTPQALRRLVSRVADLLPYSAYGKNYLHLISRPSAFERYLEYVYTPWFVRAKLLQSEWMLPAEAGFLARAFPDSVLPDGGDIVSQSLYFETMFNLIGCLLVKVDRMSMANSLEVRCPMLDHELAEMSAEIPNPWKIRGHEGKQILRRALGDRLPPELLSRRKMGFGVPLGDWFRGSLRELLWDHLTGASFLSRDIVSPAFLRELLEEHQSGRRENTLWLWSLLVLELWLQRVEELPAVCMSGGRLYGTA